MRRAFARLHTWLFCRKWRIHPRICAQSQPSSWLETLARISHRNLPALVQAGRTCRIDQSPPLVDWLYPPNSGEARPLFLFFGIPSRVPNLDSNHTFVSLHTCRTARCNTSRWICLKHKKLHDFSNLIIYFIHFILLFRWEAIFS